MDRRTVGYVAESNEATDIYVNRHYRPLRKSIEKRGASGTEIDTRAERYQFPVACGLWLQHHDLKTTEPKPPDEYLASEMDRFAETVLVTIEPDADLAALEDDD